MGAEKTAERSGMLSNHAQAALAGEGSCSGLHDGLCPAKHRPGLRNRIGQRSGNVHRIPAADLLRGPAGIVHKTPYADHQLEVRVACTKAPVQTMRSRHAERRQAGQKYHLGTLRRHGCHDLVNAPHGNRRNLHPCRLEQLRQHHGAKFVGFVAHRHAQYFGRRSRPVFRNRGRRLRLRFRLGCIPNAEFVDEFARSLEDEFARLFVKIALESILLRHH